MFQRNSLGVVFLAVLLATFAGLTPRAAAQDPLDVIGVTDRNYNSYADSVTFRIPTLPGYAYAAFLDQDRVPVDVPVVVNYVDYHELSVWRTNQLSGAVSNRLVRFIVRSSERNPGTSTEHGIPVHTPSPLIPSTAAEFAGAHLRIIAPDEFPAGYEIPLVAWVLNGQEKAVRANGWLSDAGHPSIRIRRGVGSGFLGATNPPGVLNYTPQLPGLGTNKQIFIEGSTVWSSVSGNLTGTTVWGDSSKIRVTSHIAVPAGSTLTIQANSIVLLDPGVNITNNGNIQINGTVDRPVVFMPLSRAQPWGGFFMRTSTGVINATGTLFVVSGADPNGGAGHRDEQCLFLVDSTPRITLTDCAAFNLAGQFGHAFGGGTFTLTRFLLQGATTGGEYTGANWTVNDSAFMEFPDDTANFVNGDNDGLYFVSGTHAFTNTLFGWTKDDGIDSGGSGFGPLTYQNCWFESTFHEGNSLSGFKNVNSRGTVYLDCGQGIENGYDGPTNRMEACFLTANKIGLRHGDNYNTIGNYTGREIATNSFSLYNARDVFGFNWRDSGGWTNATGQMTIVSNWLSAPNQYFPNNAIWNPEFDGWRLASFMTTPPDAPVGAGLAIRTNSLAISNIFQGVPVRLSCFTTSAVTVHFRFDAPGGSVGAGLITFHAGETLKRIYPSGVDVAGLSQLGNLTLVLEGATHGELTGITNVSFNGVVSSPQVSCRVAASQVDFARLPEGVPVVLSVPSGLPVSVNYEYEAAGGVLEEGTITFAPGQLLQWAPAPSGDLAGIGLVRFGISAPVAASLVNPTTLYFVRADVGAPATNSTLITRSALWRYRDAASAAPAGWQNLTYDDSAWPEGPAQLGFSSGPAENDEMTLIADNNQITSYFRRSFNVVDPAAFSSLSLWMLRDDGGVVYLNGTEIFRSPNVPQPPTVVTYSTTTVAPNGENDIDTATTNRNALRAGANVIAVEIHQQNATSSDVSFDFELLGNGATQAVPQHVYLATFDGQPTIAWADAGFILEQTDQLQGVNTVWTPVPGPSPVVIIPNPGDTQRFFRLKK